MSSEGSVTRWIAQLKAGDQEVAQQELWNRYFQRLAALARKKLRHAPQRVADEEDVVLNVLDTFFRGAREGRFPELRDRTNLWPLLVKITARKAANQLKEQRTQRRGGGKVRGESVFADIADESDPLLLESIADHEPTPAFAAEMAEECQCLLGALQEESLREVAQLKLAGHSNLEIAQKLRVVERTVERKLNRIRKLWSEKGES
jgi:DNA-directed RNA polymerase specialized sigma24 family protein